MRILSIAIIALLAFAGALQAQIAAPRLNPATIDSLKVSPSRLNKAFNPAVMPWSGPSRIGGAIADLEAEDTDVAGVTTPGPNGDGTMLQGRFVGENFAIGGEFYQFDLENTGGGGSQDFDGTMIALAYQYGEVFSLGFSNQTGEFSGGGGSSTATLPQFGATLRLAEVFFLGLTRGDENLEFAGGGFSVDGDRAVTHVGVGYHWREGDRGAHIELYRQSVEGIASLTEDEEESVGFTAEFVFANILVGIESFQTEATDAAGVQTEEVDETTLSVGWVPEQGLSLAANFIEEESTAAGNITLVETLILGVAWLF